MVNSQLAVNLLQASYPNRKDNLFHILSTLVNNKGKINSKIVSSINVEYVKNVL